MLLLPHSYEAEFGYKNAGRFPKMPSNHLISSHTPEQFNKEHLSTVGNNFSKSTTMARVFIILSVFMTLAALSLTAEVKFPKHQHLFSKFHEIISFRISRII
jgi:hypothetical protein